jgi:hypothetical protein
VNRYSRWQDAMYAQARLVEWYRTDIGAGYLAGFVDDMNRKHNPGARLDPRTLAGLHMKSLIEAEPVWVSDDSCELIDHARHSFEPEPVTPSDPFAPCGFALLANPIIINDAPVTEKNPFSSPDGKIPIRAISWMSVHNEDITQGCFWISYYTMIDDEDVDDPRWSGEYREQRAYFARYAPLTVAHIFQWSWWDNPWTDINRLDLVDGEDRETTLMRAKQQTQLVQTFWRIGSQFVPIKERAPRPLRRDRRRKKLKHEDDVTVITLRRGRLYEEHEPTGRELTVRHVVRGYWGKRHTREGTKQVWVHPYIRGDDSLPFKATTRAWEMTR